MFGGKSEQHLASRWKALLNSLLDLVLHPKRHVEVHPVLDFGQLTVESVVAQLSLQNTTLVQLDEVVEVLDV